MKRDWVILGSGPGEIDEKLLETCSVACVNGSYGAMMQRGLRPDAYGLFEFEAMAAHRKQAVKYANEGCKIYCTGRFVPLVEDFKAIPHGNVSRTYVYKKDMVRWPEGYRTRALRGRPIVGKSLGLGMGSATLMMLVIANEYSPETIHMVRMPGYTVDAIYADDVVPYQSGREVPEETLRRSNDCASVHIGIITRMFERTKFVFHGESNHGMRDLWRVSHQ